MNLSRLAPLIASAGAAVAMPAVVTGARAQAQVTLKLLKFPAARLQRPYQDAAALGAQGGGDSQGRRIKIDIFPSMQLGGTPPQLFDQARDGVADIVWTLPGNTPAASPRRRCSSCPSSRRTAAS